jgi:hypothetical protein
MKKQQKDDVRDLLNKIRKLQEGNTPISTLQSDDIKKLLQEQKKPKGMWEILREEEEIEIEMDNVAPTEEAQEVTPDEQREEENKFKDTVSKLVKFNKIKVFRQNVEWSGVLVREKVKWIYSLNENNGCYITIEDEDMLQLTNEVIETFKKIRGYYDVWSDEWSARLTGTPTEDGEGLGTAAPEGGNQNTAGGENTGGEFQF